MRRLVVFATLITLALGLAPGSQAAARPDLRQLLGGGTEWLDLRNGHGRAILVRREGAVYGSLRRGRVVVTSPRGRRPLATFYGCERRWRPSARKAACSGRWLRFSVLADRRIAIRGRDIDVSAAMRGSVTLEGTDGTYSIGGARAHSWPRVARTYAVGG